MISLKSFIAAIQEAIIQAGDSLMDKNIGLLDRYFTEKTEKATDGKEQKALVPKTVTLEYPALDQSLETVIRKVEVPLITLVPMTTARIEKAILTADFEMELADGQVQLDFSSKPRRGLFGKSKSTIGRLEITITPQDTPEGLNTVIEAYERALKAQIPFS
jgi:hypothetical protein